MITRVVVGDRMQFPVLEDRFLGYPDFNIKLSWMPVDRNQPGYQSRGECGWCRVCRDFLEFA